MIASFSAVSANLLYLNTFQAVSYVSRRRMDHPDFDPYEVDADGLPLVYNEERIAGFWKGKPGMHTTFVTQTGKTKRFLSPVISCGMQVSSRHVGRALQQSQVSTQVTHGKVFCSTVTTEPSGLALHCPLLFENELSVHAAPWLTKLAYAVIQGKLEQNQDQLAREAVDNLEKLGPTFIKLGQILSIR